LPPNQEALMEQHRDSCPECRAALERVIPVDCIHVFQHISAYIDDEVPADLRAQMEAHFKECKHCAAVLDGTRNIVQLLGDERAFDVPSGFSERLYRKIPKKS
jgi:anti-sigma factor RsiW